MCKLIGLIVLLSASSLLYGSGVSAAPFLLKQNDIPAIALEEYLVNIQPIESYSGRDEKFIVDLVNDSKFQSVTNVGFKNLALQFKALDDRQGTSQESIESLSQIIKAISATEKRSVPRLVNIVEDEIESSYDSLSFMLAKVKSEYANKHKPLMELDKLVSCRNCRYNFNKEINEFDLLREAVAMSELDIYEQLDLKQLISVATELKKQMTRSGVDQVDIDQQLHMNDGEAKKLLDKYLYQPCELFVKSEEANAAKLAVELTKVIADDYLGAAQSEEANNETLFGWGARYAVCDQLLKKRNPEIFNKIKEYQVL